MLRKMLVIVLLSLLLTGMVIAKTVTVKVKETRVRNAPKFYAPSIATAYQGEELEMSEEKETWMKVVLASGNEGWLHESAVEVKSFKLAAGEGVGEGATSDEVALAGKGFNEEVEKEYRQDNPNLNFAQVDELVRLEVAASQMERFLKEGHLGEFGGGR